MFYKDAHIHLWHSFHSFQFAEAPSRPIVSKGDPHPQSLSYVYSNFESDSSTTQDMICSFNACLQDGDIDEKSVLEHCESSLKGIYNWLVKYGFCRTLHTLLER